MSGPSLTPYIEVAEEALEIVSTAYVEPLRVNPYLSNASLMMARTMIRGGYEYGNG